MNFIENIKNLISKGDVKEASTNMLEDTANAILGDPVSTAKLMITFASSPFFLREQLFWMKMEAFLDGVYLNEDDCSKLRAKLVEDGEKNDNPIRLVEIIDRVETQQKIRYLINATRCLLADFIDRSTYFRICHVISHTLEEDLVFLSEHIDEEDLLYNTCIQGLLTSGLMYNSVIDPNGDQKYSFTPFAQTVDQFAVSYDNIDRYPMVESLSQSSTEPKLKVKGLPDIEEISNNEIEDLFKNEDK